MSFHSFLAVAPALALMVSPVSLAAQMARPMTAAPYETKVQCAAYNVLMANIQGPETVEGLDAGVRAELWVEAALAERPDQQAKVSADLEAEAAALGARIDQAFQSGGEDKFWQIVDELNAICAPFGG